MQLREMTLNECLNHLARTSLGRLACAHQNQPYVTPIYFAYREPCLYGFTTPGLKVEWMRLNPLVCIEVDQVDQRNQWMSIVIFGRYEELRNDEPEWKDERLRAFEILQQHARWWEPACASSRHRDTAQELVPIFYRIHIDRITGRQAAPDTSESAPSANLSRRDAPHGWLRRLVEVFSSRSGVV
jgi:nitroimidazol reductase NimA-like FMN-containing flavoprotein (pyridoxamine 5'-phosphate oxidase superfamily)